MSVNIHFDKVTIIGVGLIGGSLAITLREKGLCSKVVGVGRRLSNLERARELGVIDSFTSDVAKGVQGADLVVVAVPVAATGAVIQAARESLKKGAIVTDVGSVKGGVIAEVEPLIPEGTHFVPAHPIAGTEHSGVEAAFSGLFNKKRCIITPTEKTDPNALSTVRALWEAAGSEVVEMAPDCHDLVVAAISHLPHVIAYALVNTIAGIEEDERSTNVLRYSAGGFKDFTRIASSSPEMWSDICKMNKGHLLECIADFQETLKTIQSAISDDDFKRLKELFERAKKVRDEL